MIPSLCESCLHMREIVTPKGSRFLLCQLSQSNPEFPKISAAARRSLRGLPAEGRERSPVTYIWILLAVVGV